MIDDINVAPEEIIQTYADRHNAIVMIDARPDCLILCVINKFELLVSEGKQQIRFCKVDNIAIEPLAGWWRNAEVVLPEVPLETRCLLTWGVTLAEYSDINGVAYEE